MLQVSGEPRKAGSPQSKRWKLKAAYATIAHRMIRRIAGRIRRALLARAASLRGPVRNPFTLGPTIAVISGELAAAAKRRLFASFRRGRRLRIGVDIRPYYEPLTGIGWYLYFLLEEFAKREDVELHLYGDALRTEQGPRLHVELPPKARLHTFDLSHRRLSRLSPALARAAFPLLAWLEGCDVFFGANYFLPRSLSAIAKRRVVTVHDLTYKRYPELLQAETLANLEREMDREVFRADAIVCVSESTRRDLLDSYDISPSRAIAIHSGLAPMPDLGTTPLVPAPYILFVSTIEPRKNLDGLLDAFEDLKSRGRFDGSLVIVGKVGWKSEETVARFRTSRWRDSIRHLDYVRIDSLPAIYRGAACFVLPSHYEGFGFPLLEAMAWGVPSIAARSSSLPEIGGDAALYFEPRDSRELAAKLDQILHDESLRTTLSSRGRERAASFRWEHAAAETLAVLKNVAESQ